MLQTSPQQCYQRACSAAVGASSCWHSTKAAGAASSPSLFYNPLLSELPSRALRRNLCRVPGDLGFKNTSFQHHMNISNSRFTWLRRLQKDVHSSWWWFVCNSWASIAFGQGPGSIFLRWLLATQCCQLSHLESFV